MSADHKMIIVVLSLFFILSPRPARCKAVKIALYELAPYVSEGLENNGFTAEIITTAFKLSGYEVSTTLTSWPRALNHMEKGSMDVMANLFYTKERALKFGYPKNHLASIIYVFYINKNRTDIPENITLEDLKTMRIGLVKKAFYSERFDRMIPEFENIFWGLREIHMLQMLLADRLDIVPSSFYIGMHGLRLEAKGMEHKVKRIHSNLFEKKKLFPIFSKKRSDYQRLINDFDAQMEKMKSSGVLESIYAKHTIVYFKQN